MSGGSANVRATGGCVLWKAVSKQATCGIWGQRRPTRRIAFTLCGWCSGASGTSASRSVSTLSSMRTGSR
jgi:hypothetical protein